MFEIAIGAFVAAVALAVAFLKGKKNEKAKRAIDDAKAGEKGRKSVAAGRASGDSNNERVRKNNDRWL